MAQSCAETAVGVVGRVNVVASPCCLIANICALLYLLLVTRLVMYVTLLVYVNRPCEVTNVNRPFEVTNDPSLGGKITPYFCRC